MVTSHNRARLENVSQYGKNKGAKFGTCTYFYKCLSFLQTLNGLKETAYSNFRH